MNLLLDTHVLIWSRSQPGLLNPTARASIASRANECWISPLTAWEMNTLASKRKIALGTSVREWILRAQVDFDLQEAALSLEIVVTAGEMRFDHADPADQFLAATAKVMGLTLVTADQRLLARTDLSILAAN